MKSDKLYFLHWPEEITKKVYNIIMDTIFMNSGNIKTSDIHLLIGLRRRDKYIALSNLIYLQYMGFTIHNYLMDHILYHIQDYFEYINNHTESIK